VARHASPMRITPRITQMSEYVRSGSRFWFRGRTRGRLFADAVPQLTRDRHGVKRGFHDLASTTAKTCIAGL
jgi:hypothetical protein